MIIKDYYIDDLEQIIYKRLMMLKNADQEAKEGESNEEEEEKEEEDLCELNFQKEIKRAVPNENKEFIQQSNPPATPTLITISG